MYEAITMEQTGKPVLVLCNKGFADDARSAASSRGWPGIRILRETVPCECSVLEQVDKGIDAVVDDIIKALTGPLTPEEKTRRTVLAGFLVLILMVLLYRVYSLAPMLQDPKPLRRGVTATDALTDQCITRMWGLSRALQERKLPGTMPEPNLICNDL